MRIQLVRSRALSGMTETQGILTIGDARFYTMEQPWRDNAIGHSCVPEGVYTLSPHVSPSKGQCFILDNPALNVYAAYPPPDGGRSLILIHSANFASQLQGCIAPGLERGQIDGVDAVLDSRVAMSRVLNLLNGATHELEVTWDA